MVVVNGAHTCDNEAIFSSLEISTPSWQVVLTAELNTFHTYALITFNQEIEIAHQSSPWQLY